MFKNYAFKLTECYFSNFQDTFLWASPKRHLESLFLANAIYQRQINFPKIMFSPVALMQVLKSIKTLACPSTCLFFSGHIGSFCPLLTHLLIHPVSAFYQSLYLRKPSYTVLRILSWNKYSNSQDITSFHHCISFINAYSVLFIFSSYSEFFNNLGRLRLHFNSS